MAVVWGAQAAESWWRVLREVRPGHVAREAEQSFCVLVCGEPGAGRSTLRGALAGSRWPSAETLPYLRLADGAPDDTRGAGLVLYVLDAGRGLCRGDWEPALDLEARGVPLLYVFNKLDLIPEPDSFEAAARELLGPRAAAAAFVEATDAAVVRRRLVPLALRAAPELRLALGRRLPAFRDEAAGQVIEETARVNAELALLASLPSNLPILPLIGIGAAGADLVVLTKNQAMMLVKLAALYGRPLDSPLQLALEIAPVVGAAFLWRTLARAAVGLLPGLVSAAPRSAIAFAGTYVVGRAAQHYYRLGHRPPREALERYSREALALARRSLPPARGLRPLPPGELPPVRGLLPPPDGLPPPPRGLLPPPSGPHPA